MGDGHADVKLLVADLASLRLGGLRGPMKVTFITFAFGMGGLGAAVLGMLAFASVVPRWPFPALWPPGTDLQAWAVALASSGTLSHTVSLGLASAATAVFPSMGRASDAQGGATRLVTVKAVSASYPLRGRLSLSAGAGQPAESVAHAPEPGAGASAAPQRNLVGQADPHEAHDEQHEAQADTPPHAQRRRLARLDNGRLAVRHDEGARGVGLDLERRDLLVNVEVEEGQVGVERAQEGLERRRGARQPLQFPDMLGRLEHG